MTNQRNVIIPLGIARRGRIMFLVSEDKLSQFPATLVEHSKQPGLSGLYEAALNVRTTEGAVIARLLGVSAKEIDKARSL